MSDFHDAQWQRDYQAALAELCGGPRQLLLPAPVHEVYDSDNPNDVVPLQLSPFSIPVVPHEHDGSRADLLSRITVRKTARPFVRQVFLDGAAVGFIFQNWYGAGWLAEGSRRPCWSIADASLLVIDGIEA